MRNMVMPGARIEVIVAMMLTAVSVPEVPVRITEMIHRSAPSPGVPEAPESGG